MRLEIGSIGYIGEDGKYHKGEKNLHHDINSEARRNRQELERKIYSAEIIQPHIGGKPNPDFIKTYLNDPIIYEYFDQATIDENVRKIT